MEENLQYNIINYIHKIQNCENPIVDLAHFIPIFFIFKLSQKTNYSLEN